MAKMSRQNAAASFDPLRPRLIRVAYRMLGSVADAEDVVHEAFLRWLDADPDAVREPEAFRRRAPRIQRIKHRVLRMRAALFGVGCMPFLGGAV